METAILLLFVGFAVGFYRRGMKANAEAANTKRHTDTLDRQIDSLRSQIATMQDAESQRLKDGARRKHFFERNDITDVENQIRFISRTELRAVRPVNKEAVRVLYALDEWIAAQRPDWRLAFEVSMGAFIKTSFDPEDRMQNAAFSSYNSKRVDFLLIDRFGHPVLVVEYHGTGHGLSDDAWDRMEVKRLALARAGIPLVEVPAKASKAEIVRMVDERLSAATAPPN